MAIICYGLIDEIDVQNWVEACIRSYSMMDIVGVGNDQSKQVNQLAYKVAPTPTPGQPAPLEVVNGRRAVAISRRTPWAFSNGRWKTDCYDYCHSKDHDEL